LCKSAQTISQLIEVLARRFLLSAHTLVRHSTLADGFDQRVIAIDAHFAHEDASDSTREESRAAAHIYTQAPSRILLDSHSHATG
jgi:hypothetical protein